MDGTISTQYFNYKTFISGVQIKDDFHLDRKLALVLQICAWWRFNFARHCGHWSTATGLLTLSKWSAIVRIHSSFVATGCFICFMEVQMQRVQSIFDSNFWFNSIVWGPIHQSEAFCNWIAGQCQMRLLHVMLYIEFSLTQCNASVQTVCLSGEKVSQLFWKQRRGRGTLCSTWIAQKNHTRFINCIFKLRPTTIEQYKKGVAVLSIYMSEWGSNGRLFHLDQNIYFCWVALLCFKAAHLWSNGFKINFHCQFS